MAIIHETKRQGIIATIDVKQKTVDFKNKKR